MINKTLVKNMPDVKWKEIPPVRGPNPQGLKKGAWSAAVNAEIARGKAAGLYVDQKIIKYGNLDQLTESELETKMKQILDDHKVLIDGVTIDVTNEKNNLNKSQPA